MTGQTRMMMNWRVRRRTRTLKLTWTTLVFAPTALLAAKYMIWPKIIQIHN
ncbi:hypothetical protein PVAP13_2KG556530 [Panicum virgatum]|uniref:Uncharacterized protein n=1 Tax=Panicum virgatum TaxID=38727 RepID=A0A8T0WB75_PANVG|nr:hypothetical protein PVAP13_2KG556530 [Panicum virgatum]